MKKFTKILIALGAAGIAKYIYDHVDIVTNEELEEKIKKEAEVIAKEEKIKKHAETIAKKCDCESSFLKPRDISIEEQVEQMWENLDKKDTDFCDHLYYDNPYNISKIYLDESGCPQIFEFENGGDRHRAMKACYNFFKDVKNKMNMLEMFNVLGLIIDDYSDFDDCFVVWDPVDFLFANSENALQNTINFGESEPEDIIL